MVIFMAWFATMFPLIFSPGPANVVFAASGASVGIRRSLPFLLGVDTVTLAKSLLVGFGVAGVIDQYPAVLTVMQITGALYIAYLAVVFLKKKPSQGQESKEIVGYKSGVILHALNTKSWMMVLLMYSLFSDGAQHVFGDFAVLGMTAIFLTLSVACHIVWIAAGDFIGRFLSRPFHQKLLNVLFAISLFFVSVWIVLESNFLFSV